jgi:dihydroorotate dehydrogenase
MYRWLRPWLFRLDPETVHELAVQSTLVLTRPSAVRQWLRRQCAVVDPCRVGESDFPNRVGLAAGFDKNARWVRVAETLGFGHIEVGAVTPRPQPGHPRPRLFRLPEHGALRNRMGFNNDGVAAIATRLRQLGPRSIVVGVNLGKNSDTPLENAAADYRAVATELNGLCDFFTLNISSPNTEGLRELGHGRWLGELLEAVKPACSHPLWLKLSPDESAEYYSAAAEQALRFGLAGLVLSNTTLRRDGPLATVDAAGGISGKPLLERNLAIVRRVRQAFPALPIIGVGGIFSGDDAMRYRQAGAEIVQIYTGFVYAGPGLPRQVARKLRQEPRDVNQPA